MAFKCYYCHDFVMCSFNTWTKLSAEYWSQSSWEDTLSSKFGATVHSISEPIAERRTSYVCISRPHTNIEIHHAECCWEKTGKFLLSLDLNNTDNRLKHDREMEIGESTSKTLKKLRQKQKKSHNGHLQFILHCHKVSD